MKKTFLVLYYSLFACSIIKAQNSIFDYKGITKTVEEIIAFEKANPKMAIPKVMPNEKEAELKRRKTAGELPIPNVSQPSYTRAVQSLHSNFLAIYGGFVSGGESGFVPPDNNGDVGPTQVCVTANGRIKFFTKALLTNTPTTTPTGLSKTTAANIFNIDGDVFFLTAGTGASQFSDIHVRYDRLSQRWYLVAIDVTNTTNNYVVLAVSNGSTISNSSSFTFYKFRSSVISSTAGTFGPTTSFFDYPTLGIDKNALYIGGNNFNTSGNYVGGPMFVVNKANLIAGTLKVTGFLPGTGAGQSGSTNSAGIYTPQGAQNDDPTATEGYFVGVSGVSTSQLILKRVSTPAGTPTLSADILINITAFASPNSVKTPGNTATNPVDGGDERVYAAMIRKNKITGVNSLVIAHNSAVTSAGTQSASGNRNAARWFEIGNLTTTPTLLQNGNLYNTATTNPISYNYPSIAKSGQGHMAIGFTSAGATKNLQASYAGRYRTDALNTMQTLADVTTTTANYNGQTGTTQRWGDYTQLVVDPLDDQTIWGFGQYADTTNTWGVRAFQIKAPPPAHPVLAAIPTCSASAVVTINGTSTNNSEYFDPGADVSGPGFNKLAVAVHGPSSVAVSNVTFVNTTQVTANFNTSGMLAGTYTVVITNPDGQADSTTFIIASDCITIPLSLISFSGENEGKKNKLIWETSNENNIDNYEIERSNDNVNYNTIISQKPVNATTSSIPNIAYDEMPIIGTNYYRLKTIDNGNKISLSQVIKIENTTSKIGIVNCWPNPSKDIIHVQLNGEKNTNITLQLVNAIGEIILTKKYNMQNDLLMENIDLTPYANGTYYLQYVNNNFVQSKIKVTKVQ